jgi:hypothetical protein
MLVKREMPLIMKLLLVACMFNTPEIKVLLLDLPARCFFEGVSLTIRVHPDVCRAMRDTRHT